jgi:methylated-DNA-[protein]-cysteine S-methyltransferase
MRTDPPRSARYCLFETGVGDFGLAWNERGVVRLQLPDEGRMTTEKRLRAFASQGEPPPWAKQLIAEIRHYLAGKRVDFASVALDLATVGEFRLAVYEAARSVAWGQTTSYGELARRIGFPWGARAVGRALARNPVPLIVPCHRILARDERIGGFSTYGGTLTKRRLLALEGVHVGGTSPLPGLAEPAPTSGRSGRDHALLIARQEQLGHLAE